MLYIKFRGKLGNNLFQYALGHLLSKKYDIKMSVLFNGDKNRRVFSNFINAYNSIKFQCPPIKECDILRFKNYRGETLDNNKNYILDGFFQFYDLYVNNKEDLRHLYSLSHIKNPVVEKYNPNKDDSILIIRLTDMKRIIGETEYDYIDDMLKQHPYGGNLYVISENTEDKIYTDFMKKYDCIQIPVYDAITHFQIIQKFNRIYLGPSTFAWWAAWLSDAQFICYPCVGFWSDFFSKSNNNIFVTDESRYHKYYYHQYTRWN